MQKITWTCPNCWTKYDTDEKFADALKSKTDCKFCVRKDPNVPTTAEVDGLIELKDMRDRHTVMKQCINCEKWTKMQYDESIQCDHCGYTGYDPQSTTSLRTFNPETNRKVKMRKPAKIFFQDSV